MKTYDYAFLNMMPLPQGFASLLPALRRLDSLCAQQLALSPQQREGVIQKGWEAATTGAASLEDVPPAAYGQALQAVSQQFDDIEATREGFLQLNRLLLPKGAAGAYGSTEKSQAADLAFSAYVSAAEEADAFLLIPCITLDLLCTAPFPNAPAGTVFLLARLLLCKAGYTMCSFLPLEAMIHRYFSFYHRAFQESALYWAEGHNDYLPYMQIFLSLLYLSYRQCLSWIPARKRTKRASIEELVLNRQEPISKSDICAALPMISPTTVEAVLGSMVKAGAIRRIGGGRGTKYLPA
ncbi:hypothetical protein [Acutalibacter caecimuris]|uniref:hypothetical protein n=1 Tax=Acutalibacter caecimuris TaxID=3093657 RepID=UPI002AC8A55B|nr:hypothetical protein [Acutalibacter sp. M00118]